MHRVHTRKSFLLPVNLSSVSKFSISNHNSRGVMGVMTKTAKNRTNEKRNHCLEGTAGYKNVPPTLLGVKKTT